MALQRSDLDVAVEHVEQSGELSDHRVPLSHADLRHRHQHLQLHLLSTARLYGDTAGTNFTASQRLTHMVERIPRPTALLSYLVGPPRWPWRCSSGPERRSPSAGTGRCLRPGWPGTERPECLSCTARPANRKYHRTNGNT